MYQRTPQSECEIKSNPSCMQMSNVGGMCVSLQFCLVLKGMVEVVAENYHNIWAKKKKSDLGSRGDLLMKPIRNAYCLETHEKQTGRVCVCVGWVELKCWLLHLNVFGSICTRLPRWS